MTLMEFHAYSLTSTVTYGIDVILYSFEDIDIQFIILTLYIILYRRAFTFHKENNTLSRVSGSHQISGL